MVNSVSVAVLFLGAATPMYAMAKENQRGDNGWHENTCSGIIRRRQSRQNGKCRCGPRRGDAQNRPSFAGTPITPLRVNATYRSLSGAAGRLLTCTLAPGCATDAAPWSLV